jgi:urate oxidase
VVHAYGHANGTRKVIGGIRDLIVLKTTQTGFINFYRNEHATLPDAEDRLLATNVAATWLYSSPSGVDFHAAAAKVKSILMDTFFGNAKLGVYSYSVQQTLHDMGVAVLNK